MLFGFLDKQQLGKRQLLYSSQITHQSSCQFRDALILRAEDGGEIFARCVQVQNLFVLKIDTQDQMFLTDTVETQALTPNFPH